MRIAVLQRRPVVLVLLFALVVLWAPPGVGAQEDTGGDPPELTPGLPAPDDSEIGTVHSWALTPAGAGAGSQSGDRANLSYEMAPGTQVRDRVTLFNFSNVPLEFEVFPVDARNNDDGAFAPVSRDEQQRSVGAWISLPVDTVEVPAGQAATFDIFVNVPPDARPGDHAGAILASNDAQGSGPDGRVVTLDRETGTRVYIRVDGPLQPELAVAALGAHYSPKLNPLGGTAKVTYRIENRGNVRLAGTHQVSMGGPFGWFTTSGPLRELPELLPGESFEFTEDLEGVAGTVAAFTKVDLEPLAVDGSTAAIRAEDRSAIGLALPLLVIAVIIAGSLLWMARRRYRRHRELSVALRPPDSDGHPGRGGPRDAGAPGGSPTRANPQVEELDPAHQPL